MAKRKVLDLKTLQPTRISRDLKDKYILLYGLPKIGKTAMAASFPRNLILAAQVGYHAIDNINVVDINSWLDFKDYLKQLEDPEVHELYDTVTIDTVSRLWTLCEKYICSVAGVQEIGQIPWGRGFTKLQNEFADALTKITILHYGLILIAHSDIRTGMNEKGKEIQYFAPSLDKRCYNIVNPLVDIIGYITKKSGTNHRVIYTRATDEIMAGSRYGNLAPEIPFGYNELNKALSEAIQEREREGALMTDEVFDRAFDTSPTRSFEDTMEELNSLMEPLLGENVSEEDFMKNQAMISGMVKKFFGDASFRLSEAVPEQQPIIEEFIEALKKRD